MHRVGSSPSMPWLSGRQDRSANHADLQQRVPERGCSTRIRRGRQLDPRTAGCHQRRLSSWLSGRAGSRLRHWGRRAGSIAAWAAPDPIRFGDCGRVPGRARRVRDHGEVTNWVVSRRAAPCFPASVAVRPPVPADMAAP